MGTPANQSSFVLELKRRGVPLQRYEEDMAAFQALIKQHSLDEGQNNILCIATLGVSIFLQLCCCRGGEPADLGSFMQKARNQCNDMNIYYNQFGIRWSVELVGTQELSFRMNVDSCG